MVRQELNDVLADLGLTTTAVVETVGDFPSPTILINGVDVTGVSGTDAAGCRLDLPIRKQIRIALEYGLTTEAAGIAAAWLAAA